MHQKRHFSRSGVLTIFFRPRVYSWMPCSKHGFVLIDFLKDTFSPIVKDAQGDLSSCSNYRGITLGCLPAKLLEYALQLKSVYKVPIHFNLVLRKKTALPTLYIH